MSSDITRDGERMSTVVDPTGDAPALPIPRVPTTSAGRVRKGLTNPVASVIAIVIGIVWTIPTLGLLVQSFRC
jgi:alpha-glucoside transport system permease protein